MERSEMKNVGSVIRDYRERKGISAREVGRRTGINPSTVSRLELGTHNPSIEILSAIAEAVDAPMTEVLTAANLIESDDLPAFTPYLRTKYKYLPPKAHREIAAHFEQVARSYGISEMSGPQPGEDE